MFIIFDLDDTLIDTSGSVMPMQMRRAVQKMMEEGLEVGDVEEAVRQWQEIDRQAESGSVSLKIFLDSVSGSERLLEVGRAVLCGVSEESEVKEMEGCQEVLMRLKEKGHTLALVSIGNPEFQRVKMEKGGINSALFSKIVIIREEGKGPVYAEMLQEWDPKQTVVCGDRIRRDLTPAKELGCWTVHIRWGRGLRPTGREEDVDFNIDRLKELEEIVETL